jgi:hypothetical protein
VPQIGEITSGVRETSKLGGTQLIFMFPVGVFTRFNCALVTTQNISIDWVRQIRESTKGVPETSKLGGTRLIWLFPVGLFTRFNCAIVQNVDFTADESCELERVVGTREEATITTALALVVGRAVGRSSVVSITRV